MYTYINSQSFGRIRLRREGTAMTVSILFCERFKRYCYTHYLRANSVRMREKDTMASAEIVTMRLRSPITQRRYNRSGVGDGAMLRQYTYTCPHSYGRGDKIRKKAHAALIINELQYERRYTVVIYTCVFPGVWTDTLGL